MADETSGYAPSKRVSDTLTAYGAFRPGYGGDGAAAEDYLSTLARTLRSDSKYGNSVYGQHGSLFVKESVREFMRGAGEAYGKLAYGQSQEEMPEYERSDIGKLPSNYSGGHCKTCTCSGSAAGYTSGKMIGSYLAKGAATETMKDGLEGKLD